MAIGGISSASLYASTAVFQRGRAGGGCSCGECAACGGTNAAGSGEKAGAPGAGAGPAGNQLSQAEQQQVAKLKQRDAEVRQHEQAHANAGGAHAGSPQFEYQKGPDGRDYAIGGEVPIDVSAVPNNPEATIAKMETVKRAALAPAQPSPQDLRVAAQADQVKIEAIQEKNRTASEGGDEAAPGAEGAGRNAATNSAKADADAAAGSDTGAARRSASTAGLPQTEPGINDRQVRADAAARAVSAYQAGAALLGYRTPSLFAATV